MSYKIHPLYEEMKKEMRMEQFHISDSQLYTYFERQKSAYQESEFVCL